MSKKQPTPHAAVARVLAKMADSLEADQPDDEMTNAARIGQICQFIPGQPDLFDHVFPATPPVVPQCTRREYAAELRAVTA
ncbi:hypothetical protein [Streptomyces sp. NPDC001530]|uniref:hypothetical protein n=1 Tax=Streptomyces sp. NPDC001530 TaxID=3364582 RepID=UPI00369F3145